MPVDERMIRRLVGCLTNPSTGRQNLTLEEVKAIVRTVATGLDIPAFFNYDPLTFAYEGDCITFRVINTTAGGFITYKNINKRFRFHLTADSLLEI